MNIVYVENTEVPFDSIVDGECFSYQDTIYMKVFRGMNIW